MIWRLVSRPTTALAFRYAVFEAVSGVGAKKGSANSAKLSVPYPARAVATVSALATVGNSWNILWSAISGHTDKYHSNQQLHI